MPIFLIGVPCLQHLSSGLCELWISEAARLLQQERLSRGPAYKDAKDVKAEKFIYHDDLSLHDWFTEWALGDQNNV